MDSVGWLPLLGNNVLVRGRFPGGLARNENARPARCGPGASLSPMSGGYCCSGMRISRLPTWFADETTPSSSICSTSRAALL